MMNESYLHYLWKYRLFENELTSDEDEAITIENPGHHNLDAGPDFFEARIRIGPTLWVGNVEIHVKSSDWHKHNHDKDPAYQNIILHVVYENDKDIGINAPTLEIKNNVNKRLYERYLDLVNNKNWIPCESLGSRVDYFIWESWKERLAIEKLEHKAGEIKALLTKHKNNWEECFYISIARNFGFKINNAPFELLAKSLPLKYLAKHKNNLLQVEALLYGQAGLLSGKEFEDAYPRTLQKEYKHLQAKFSLRPIDQKLWRFLRLRPANFPHIRLAQFAQLIHKSTSLFSFVLEAQEIQDIKNLLIVKASNYWENHYTFDKVSPAKAKFLGNSAIDLVIINTIIPYIFVYGMVKEQQSFKERALDFLSELPPESNSIIKKYSRMGLEIRNAFHSQALIYLKKNYCTPKKCLHCPVGKQIVT